jgi:hypothetical protein
MSRLQLARVYQARGDYQRLLAETHGKSKRNGSGG